jgi:hypothetical protein
LKGIAEFWAVGYKFLTPNVVKIDEFSGLIF